MPHPAWGRQRKNAGIDISGGDNRCENIIPRSTVNRLPNQERLACDRLLDSISSLDQHLASPVVIGRLSCPCQIEIVLRAGGEQRPPSAPRLLQHVRQGTPATHLVLLLVLHHSPCNSRREVIGPSPSPVPKFPTRAIPFASTRDRLGRGQAPRSAPCSCSFRQALPGLNSRKMVTTCVTTSSAEGRSVQVQGGRRVPIHPLADDLHFRFRACSASAAPPC